MENKKCEIKFNVRHQSISRIDSFHIVSKSRNYLVAEFNFLTKDWEGLSKTAIFRNSNNAYNQILQDNKCGVPWEWLETPGKKMVSVFGGDRITTDAVCVEVYESGYADGETPTEPTPDVYEQILKRIEEISAGQVDPEQLKAVVDEYLEENPIETLSEQDVQKIVASYVTEHKDELKGDKGDPGEKGADGEPGKPGADGADGKDGTDGTDGYTPVKGTDYWTPEDIREIQSYIDQQIGGALNGSY